jgi:hypothetical protein
MSILKAIFKAVWLLCVVAFSVVSFVLLALGGIVVALLSMVGEDISE